MPKSNPNVKPRAARGADTASIKARIDRSGVVSTSGSTSTLWTVPAVKDSGTALVTAGSNLTAGEQLVNNLESQLTTARASLNTLTFAWDEAYGLYCTNVESNAQKPADITGGGLLLLDRSLHTLLPALGLTVRYDTVNSVIRVLVKRPPPGDQKCLLEVSPDPVGATTFKAVTGYGGKRALAGYAPGTWWLRVALVDATDQSAYFGPVAVIVK